MLNVQMKFAFMPAKVTSAARKGNKRAFTSVGSLARRTMRTSIRSVKKRTTTSKEGQFPRSHTGGAPGLRTIEYAATPGGQGIVAGPIRFGGKKKNLGRTVPAAVNDGGAIEILEAQIAGGSLTRAKGTGRFKKGIGWRSVGEHLYREKQRQGKPTRKRTVRIGPRPFKQLTLKKMISSKRLPNMWRNIVKRGL